MNDMSLTVTRLEQVIGALERVPASRLDMSVWWEPRDWGEPAGCAIGWAIQRPEVSMQGLKLRHDPDGYQVVYGEREGYSAVAQFLGISKREAFRLFNPGYYETRQKEEVLKCLRAYLEHCKVKDEHATSHQALAAVQQMLASVKQSLGQMAAQVRRLPVALNRL